MIAVHAIRNGFIDVRITINRDGMHADGRQVLRPDDRLFGKAAGDVAAGIYDDDGTFVCTFEDFFLKRLAQQDAWQESEHPRVPKGSGDPSGEFTSKGGGEGDDDTDTDEEDKDAPRAVMLEFDADGKVVMYHGTSTAAFQSIEKNGLKPHGSEGADTWVLQHGPEGAAAAMTAGDRKFSVYFTDTPRHALMFSQLASQVRHSDPIILRIALPVEEAKKVTWDEGGERGMLRYKGEVKPEYITPIRIDPKLIERMNKSPPLVTVEERKSKRATKHDAATGRIIYAIVYDVTDQVADAGKFEEGKHKRKGRGEQGGGQFTFKTGSEKEKSKGGGGMKAKSGTTAKAAKETEEPKPPTKEELWLHRQQLARRAAAGTAQREPSEEEPDTRERGDTSALSKNESESIRYYTGAGNYQINAFLRGDNSDVQDIAETKKAIKDIDSALRKASLAEDTEGYRMVSKTLYAELVSKLGSTVVEPGYTSISHGGVIKEEGATERVHVVLPKGSHAMHLGELSQYQGEKEILVARNARFKVSTIGQLKGPAILTLTLVPGRTTTRRDNVEFIQDPETGRFMGSRPGPQAFSGEAVRAARAESRQQQPELPTNSNLSRHDIDRAHASVRMSFENVKNYDVIAPEDSHYNCVAWACGDDTRYWWPRGWFWPELGDTDVRDMSVDEAFDDLFIDELHGDVMLEKSGAKQLTADQLDSIKFDPDNVHLARFVESDGLPQHLARQASDGRWLSKMGGEALIKHVLSEMSDENSVYGTVDKVYRVPLKNWLKLRKMH